MLKEACGVFGIAGTPDASRLTYYALNALQHRGQESAGIAVSDGETIGFYKDEGLASEVFKGGVIDTLKGTMAIGHVRYSTAGGSGVINAQPLVVRYREGYMGLAHNGNLVNSEEIKDYLEDNGSILQTTTDSELFLHLLARYHDDGLVGAIMRCMGEVKGSYSITLLTQDRLIGFRDPWGLRPLSLGRLGDSLCIVSETVAFDIIGAEYIRDIEPGEIVVIENGDIKSYRYMESSNNLCIFEYIYFARPDSVLGGLNVYEARKELGRTLAKECPADADMVIGVPDSGTFAAIGFAEVSGIPLGEGLIKSRYAGRTFIEPEQKLREIGVRLKLNVLKERIRGKRLVVVDDSIVRGNTSRRLVKMIRDAGAKEVHMRVAAPPVISPCYFGIDIPTKEELVASYSTVDEIKQTIGVDSLGYLSVNGMIRSLKGHGYCTGCFTGKYPMEIPEVARPTYIKRPPLRMNGLHV
ncbi:amidophosphoribosyltransferase [Calorimonas adulescens]|uniref:Amidophosphoribosyltransferase n=1 Tax=Calorimonas adulescens TaxID=2606906 RepID=A0A5D8QEE9_9THEO|nr:amidophosphoribosyltransferase [Calorimonas adulescens]TZE82549.1 amidophosphoribosyltransferase [Calorimonas adulescens]